jgi:hypothetical protein
MIEFNERVINEFELQPDSRQLAVLEEMLEGPLLLQRLLALEVVLPTTLEEASEFLDRNWKRLAPYMFRAGLTQSPKSTERLILSLARERADAFTLEFTSSCYFMKGRAYVPITDLGPILLTHSQLLVEALKRHRHTGAFGLCRGISGFSVLVDWVPTVTRRGFEPMSPPDARRILGSPVDQGTRSGRTRCKTRTKGMLASDFLSIFNSRVTEKLRQQLKISRQLGTTQFDALSGRPVSGGLPSLGKRR